jgi:DUF4097 and DUF4098 domain-containing protein YvlB
MNRFSLILVSGLGLVAPAYAEIPFDETRALNPNARVSLENMQGRIEVTTWDRDEIHISGSRADGTEGLSIEGDADRLQVTIVYPKGRGWFGTWGRIGDSTLRVTVPVGVALDVEAVSAAIDVRGIAGKSLSIDSVSGDIDVDSAAQQVEIDNVSGDANLLLRSGDVAVDTVSGDIVVRGAMNGRIKLDAVSGSVRIESDAAARQIEAGVVSGDVELKVALQPGGRISAESLSGDLVVSLAAGTSARLDASSFTGKIRSDHGKVETEEFGPGSSLSTTLGSGEGRIQLETFSGDLTIRQR